MKYAEDKCQAYGINRGVDELLTVASVGSYNSEFIPISAQALERAYAHKAGDVQAIRSGHIGGIGHLFSFLKMLSASSVRFFLVSCENQ